MSRPFPREYIVHCVEYRVKSKVRRIVILALARIYVDACHLVAVLFALDGFGLETHFGLWLWDVGGRQLRLLRLMGKCGLSGSA